MSRDIVVAAVGHTFAPLEIETKVLTPRGIALIDANNGSAAELAAHSVAGILLGSQRKLDGAFLEGIPSLKTVVRCGIGVDNIDVATARRRGIVVCNVRDYCIEEVAVHVLACALSLSRALAHWDEKTRAGAWRSGPRPRLRRLSRCTLGIIGFGQIGQALAVRAVPIFGAVLAYDPLYRPAGPPPAGVTFVDSLDRLIGEADVVTVHAPMTPQTKGMLGAAAFARMKKDTYVINAARGGIVDEAALVAAVRAGTIAGAALDTFVTEPLKADDPLLQEKRILLSPHIAWVTEEAEIELREHAAEEVARVLLGEPPRSQVNVA